MKNNTVKEYPYEKFECMGAEALSDAELLAITIRTGTADYDAMELARKVLTIRGDKEDGILSLQHVSVQELMQIKGIGKVKAIKIKCMVEFAKRMAMETVREKVRFNSPATIAAYYMEKLRHLETEHVYLVLLDNKNKLIKDVLISKGTVNASVLSPREIFVEALRSGAVKILLLHNHPSGDPVPSKQDLEITQIINSASKLLNIPLLDHMIIGDNKYTSLKEKGYL